MQEFEVRLVRVEVAVGIGVVWVGRWDGPEDVVVVGEESEEDA